MLIYLYVSTIVVGQIKKWWCVWSNLNLSNVQKINSRYTNRSVCS
jgi:hypothetical protein